MIDEGVGRVTDKMKRYQKLYRRQRTSAKERGIPWEITYRQWYRIWLESGHWNERGKGLGKYVMARYGDKGPYAPWNVKIILNEENSREGNIGNSNHLGHKHSDLSRQKISEAKRGNTNWLGRKHNLATRRKMSKSARKAWEKRKSGPMSKTPSSLVR